MERNWRESFKAAGREFLEDFRERENERISEAVFEEKIVGIEKATAALYEAGVGDERIITLLQKYWDLRLSEAKEFLEVAKDRLENGERV